MVQDFILSMMARIGYSQTPFCWITAVSDTTFLLPYSVFRVESWNILADPA
jgi:hypothetical protein